MLWAILNTWAARDSLKFFSLRSKSSPRSRKRSACPLQFTRKRTRIRPLSFFHSSLDRNCDLNSLVTRSGVSSIFVLSWYPCHTHDGLQSWNLGSSFFASNGMSPTFWARATPHRQKRKTRTLISYLSSGFSLFRENN